jgi:hypothetical protein
MNCSKLLRLSGILSLVLTTHLAHAFGETALVTATKGKVARVMGSSVVAMEPFVALGEGEVLQLEQGDSVRLLYFASSRQEIWEGGGRLDIGTSESKARGLATPEVSVLPPVVVRQIAKTPSLDSQGRLRATRLRSVAPPDALSKLEAEYERLRIEGGEQDLNAEIFLLAGLFELRELDRVESMINDLAVRHKNNTDTKVLISLYRKALNSARQRR